MCKWAFVILATLAVSGLAQNISSKAKLINPNEYFYEVIQAVIYDIEEMGFSKLKLQDYTENVTVTLYDWKVTGKVHYTNGFLNSIEKIDISDISSLILSNKADIRGVVHFRDAKIGYDVTANMDNEGKHRFTGLYTHSGISSQFGITKDMATGEYSVYSTVTNLSSGSGVRMVYLPASNISQVLSREIFSNSTNTKCAFQFPADMLPIAVQYESDTTFKNVRSWNQDIFEPLLLKRAQDIKYPEVCFNC